MKYKDGNVCESVLNEKIWPILTAAMCTELVKKLTFNNGQFFCSELEGINSGAAGILPPSGSIDGENACVLRYLELPKLYASKIESVKIISSPTMQFSNSVSKQNDL